MPLREPAPLPDHPLLLARFLATSLTFTTRVHRVALHWDDRVLCEFEKVIDGSSPLSPSPAGTPAASTDLPIPSNLNSVSPERMLRLDRLSSSRVQITALHHPLLLVSAKAAELELRQKKARAAEQASKSGLSAGAAAVAGFFGASSASTERTRGVISNLFGFGYKNRAAAAASPAPPTPPVPRALAPAPAPVDTERSLTLAAQRDAKPVTTIVHFRIATAHLTVSADPAFIKEIERSTKKPPPTRTAFSVVFADRDEVRRSRGESLDAVTGKLAVGEVKEKEKEKASEEGKSTQEPGAITLDEKDERRLTNRHLFGTLLPWLSGNAEDESDSSAVVKSGARRAGNVTEDDAVARMAREQQGHVFIGFRTHQTTGFAGHLAARFIPTVERESLDFIDKYCRSWNEELLAMGGYLIRALYEREMTLLGEAWTKEFKATSGRPAENDAKAKQTAEDFFDRALHLLRFFTIRTSHPSGKVAEILQNRFFAVSAEGQREQNRMMRFIQSTPSAEDRAIQIMSSCGVWPSSKVRLPNDILTPFIKQLPMLPAAHVSKAAEFIRSCTSRGLLMEVQMPDVFAELEQRPLEVEEMKACLKWFILVATHPEYDPALRTKLFSAAVLTISTPAEDGKEVSLRIQPLGEVATYLNSQRIPTGFPLPSSCLAYEVSKGMSTDELSGIFGWRELPVSQWISHLVEISATSTSEEDNIQKSPAFSERVFVVLARAWGNISATQQVQITESLQGVACIPTRNGSMQKPPQAYFPSVSLFDDLPIVTIPAGASIVKGNLEKVLTALGVRKHVELQMIFTRLLAAGDWSHVDLVGYLSTNEGTLTKEEKDRLKKTAMFPMEGEKAIENVGDAEAKPKIKRYRAKQLYEPVPALRALGLPLLDWTKSGSAQEGTASGSTGTAAASANKERVWRAQSDEAKFLFQTLGLKRHPPIKVLLEKASDAAATQEAAEMRTRALTYLREKWDSVYASQYDYQEACQYAFVPCVPPASTSTVKAEDTSAKPATPYLRPPHEAFLNSAAALLKFDVIDTSKFSTVDVARFRLKENPTPAALMRQMLALQTRDKARAQLIFEYLASVSTFTATEYHYLRDKNFVPVTRPGTGASGVAAEQVDLVAPTLVYFGSDRSSSLSYKDVFTFVIFSETASYFLRNCGVTDEPTIEEVAQKLIRDPRRFYKLAGSSDNYLAILRQIATNWRRIPRKTQADMRGSAFLLGVKREKTKQVKEKDEIPNIMDQEEDEEQGTLIYDLLRPKQVVIADDAIAHMIFGSSAFFAPHDEHLEQFLYLPLGCPKLSQLVEEQQAVRGEVLTQSSRADQIKDQILERTPLFIFEEQKTQRGDIVRDTEWLRKHLFVKGVEGKALIRQRTFKHDGKVERHTQYTTALTTYANSNLQLFVSISQELDWFEIASVLNQYLLRRQDLSQVLLYMTMLSTSLRDLKRRGFHVDRIIQQKEAEKQAADRRMREAQEKEQEAERKRLKEAQKRAAAAPQPGGSRLPYVGPGGPEKSLVPTAGNAADSSSQEWEQAAAAAAAAAVNANGTHGGRKTISNMFKGRFGKQGNADLSSLASGTSSISRGPNSPIRAPPNPIAAAGRSTVDPSSTSGPTMMKDMQGHSEGKDPTPLETIQSGVTAAVNASRVDGSQRIQSQVEKTKRVAEAESSYCDVGISADLTKAGVVDGMNIYLSPEYRDPARTLADNHGPIQRLIQAVYRPVGEGVFGIKPGVLNIFCDVEGPTIAFNRGGTIFLNLRFYLALHDDKVRNGLLGEAIISVYHSLAHELAHNLVSDHNSQHEYWVSAISEQYFLRLAGLLKSVGVL